MTRENTNVAATQVTTRLGKLGLETESRRSVFRCVDDVGLTVRVLRRRTEP